MMFRGRHARLTFAFSQCGAFWRLYVHWRPRREFRFWGYRRDDIVPLHDFGVGPLLTVSYFARDWPR